MNEQLAAIRRIRPAIDASVERPAAPRQLALGVSPEPRQTATPPRSDQPTQATANATNEFAGNAEPRADEGWRRQLIHALKNLDRQGLRLDAPNDIGATPETVHLPLPVERIPPPRIIARPKPVQSVEPSPTEGHLPEHYSARSILEPVASARPADAAMPPKRKLTSRSQSSTRVVSDWMSQWLVAPIRHHAVQVAGVLALASLVSSNPLHSAIPPEPRANLASFSIAFGDLRQEGARLLSAERTIERAVARASIPPISGFTSDPILEMTPRLVGAGHAADDIRAQTSAPSAQPDALDRQGLQSLIASLPDDAPSTPDVRLTPAPEAAAAIKKKGKTSTARAAPESVPVAPPAEPLVRIAPEAEDLDAAESGDGEVRPVLKQERRKATRTPRKVASARKRPPLQGERRMSVGATPIQPTTVVQSSGLFGYIGSLIRPEPRLWSDPSVARP